MSYRSLAGPFALGAATGARTTLALATLAFSDRRPNASKFTAALQSRAGRVTAAVLVGLELVGDKLPVTPSRWNRLASRAGWRAGCSAAPHSPGAVEDVR